MLVVAAHLFAAPIRAGNGNSLHGIGAVNSALGGAGAGLPHDPLGALHLNPALLTQLDGHRLAFGAELFDDEGTVESSVGPFSGSTDHEGDPALIPAFGFTAHRPGSRFAYGVGFLGLAGFAVDFPQDSTNPIFAPQPQGFGRTQSSYALLKVPVAFAYQVGPRLSVGGALLVSRASLSVTPAGFAAPDCSARPAVCFVPSVNTDGAWGVGAQVGIAYRLSARTSFGLSYASEIEFEDFEWNSAVANPNLPSFGTRRKIKLQINNPPVAVAGFGWTPSQRWKLAADVKWMGFEDAQGFAETLRWQDVVAFGVGAQLQATPRLSLRAGFNSTENAIPDEVTFLNVPAPAIFSDHAAVGLGVRATETLTLDLGYYRAFPTEISGPFLTPAGPIPGTRVATEVSTDSLLLTLSFDL